MPTLGSRHRAPIFSSVMQTAAGYGNYMQTEETYDLCSHVSASAIGVSPASLSQVVNIPLRRRSGGDVGVTAVEQTVADGVIALDEGNAPGLKEGVIGDLRLVSGDVGEGLVGALS